MQTYTLNDEWLMGQIIDRVEKVGETLGYCLIKLDACGCVGQEASWSIEKDGYYRQVELEDLIPDYSYEAIGHWLRNLTFYTL